MTREEPPAIVEIKTGRLELWRRLFWSRLTVYRGLKRCVSPGSREWNGARRSAHARAHTLRSGTSEREHWKGWKARAASVSPACDQWAFRLRFMQMRDDVIAQATPRPFFTRRPSSFLSHRTPSPGPMCPPPRPRSRRFFSLSLFTFTCAHKRARETHQGQLKLKHSTFLFLEINFNWNN